MSVSDGGHPPTCEPQLAPSSLTLALPFLLERIAEFVPTPPLP